LGSANIEYYLQNNFKVALIGFYSVFSILKPKKADQDTQNEKSVWNQLYIPIEKCTRFQLKSVPPIAG